jgi:hypothetical protein
MASGTKYSSDTNDAWLSREELLRMLAEWEADHEESHPRKRISDFAERVGR